MQNEAENMKPAAQGDGIGFLKAAPLLGLPAAHVLFEAVTQGLAGKELYSLADPLTALANFGPTIFMFCMGCGVAGSRTTPKRLARQGIQLILIQILIHHYHNHLRFGFLHYFHLLLLHFFSYLN